MPWHVGSDDRGSPLHYSCRVAGEGEGVVVVECCERGRKIRGVIPSAGACEGVRVLPGCKDQRRSSTQQLGSVSYHHPEAPLTHWQRSVHFLNTALGLANVWFWHIKEPERKPGLLIMSNIHLIKRAQRNLQHHQMLIDLAITTKSIPVLYSIKNL